jgi:sialate O-acetylesterase
MTARRIAPFLLIALAPAAHGEVKLPKLFTSHMVLQRDRPIHIWGWADPGEAVSAALNGASESTMAGRLGQWNLYLPAQPAGGPYQLTVTGRKAVTLDDILIGDIWFASGQSNMEMPLSGFAGSAVVNNARDEIARANHPRIRLLFVPHKASPFPLRDFDTNQPWTVCTPETAAKFSAVAYFFGREIADRENVPIGLIDSSWGGTPAEAWMSIEGLSADSSLMPVFAEYAEMSNAQADVPLVIAEEKREDAAALSAHAPAPQHPWHPDPASWDPTWLYNGMVAPAVDFGIKGVIWYQGESNSRRDMASMYEKVFPALIEDWRAHWRQGNFPFLFVQISSFKPGSNETWPIVRDAQRRTLALANTGMAVTIDVGDATNVHPSDKQTVGARLALAARAIAYGENVEYAGPLFRQTSNASGAIHVWFDHADGLMARGSDLQGFEIAGEDHHFVPATAHIDGAGVAVSSPQVPRPAYVRYGWQGFPAVNLYNAAGLPASPFTSEERIPAP